MSELTNQPVVGTHIHVGYEPSETEQALVRRVHELEGKLEAANLKINNLTSAYEVCVAQISKLRREKESLEFDLESIEIVYKEMRRANR